tara:strand:+ start:1797 stop:2075 length:279 start_codon:yes stop_codon:yes gene_type:complete
LQVVTPLPVVHEDGTDEIREQSPAVPIVFVDVPSLLENPVSHAHKPAEEPVRVHNPRPLHSVEVEVPSTVVEPKAIPAVFTGNVNCGTSPGT